MSDNLTIEENGVLLGLIRDGIRKTRRNRARGVRRWGPEYDEVANNRKTVILESLYVKFGGDPRRISEHGERLPRE